MCARSATRPIACRLTRFNSCRCPSVNSMWIMRVASGRHRSLKPCHSIPVYRTISAGQRGAFATARAHPGTDPASVQHRDDSPREPQGSRCFARVRGAPRLLRLRELCRVKQRERRMPPSAIPRCRSNHRRIRRAADGHTRQTLCSSGAALRLEQHPRDGEGRRKRCNLNEATHVSPRVGGRRVQRRLL